MSKHVKKTLHHDKFKEVLKSKSPLRKLVTSITSDKHTVNTTESNKIALSAFDDKRYYLSDGIIHTRMDTTKLVTSGNSPRKNLKSPILRSVNVKPPEI